MNEPKKFLLPEVGIVGQAPTNWRDHEDEDPDPDDEDPPTPPDVIAVLGFDPDEIDWDEKD